jgi:hypothetical protein
LLLLHILTGGIVGFARFARFALLVSADTLADGVNGVRDAAVFDAGFEETHCFWLEGDCSCVMEIGQDR